MERSGVLVEHIADQATIVNVDHHGSNTLYGDVNVIEPQAAAVGEIVLRMLDDLGYPVTPDIATNLYTAVMTDTGGFRHENTTAECLETAARLARLGAVPSDIAAMVYKSRPLTTLKLSALSLATMRVDMGGLLVWARVTRHMLREAGAAMAESEGIIDTINSIGGIKIGILFKEVGPRVTKISVRTRDEIDASALASRFDGGGHYRAAGAEIQMPIDDAVPRVLEAAADELRALTGAGSAVRDPQPR
jgi:phosphoesterase RecJ-like protein